MYFVKISTRWYFSTLHKSFREVLKAFLQSTRIKSSSPISSRHVALSQKEINWFKMTRLWQIYVESCLPPHHLPNTLFVPVLFQEFICLVCSPVLCVLPPLPLEMDAMFDHFQFSRIWITFRPFLYMVSNNINPFYSTAWISNVS